MKGDDIRKVDPKFKQPRFEQYLNAVEKLDEFAQENYNKRVIHLALRWVLDKAQSDIALWGGTQAFSIQTHLKKFLAGRWRTAHLSRLIKYLEKPLQTRLGQNSWRLPQRVGSDSTSLLLKELIFMQLFQNAFYKGGSIKNAE